MLLCFVLENNDFFAFDRFSLSFIPDLCAIHNLKLLPEFFCKVRSSPQFR